jgi:regulator of sigma E protease
MSMPLPLDIFYFLIALAILISVHEFGHFWVARLVGVKVLRFSIGFGRALLRYQRNPDTTEYVLAAIPLGGYVKMLDEREEEVPAHQVDQAFNRQVLWKRFAVVAAGPLFNFLFAILAYWAVFMAGESGLRAVVGSVEPDSIAAQAGFQEGDSLVRVGDRDAPIWERVVFALMLEQRSGQDLRVTVRDASGREQERWIDAEPLSTLPEDASVLEGLGLHPQKPRFAAVIGKLIRGEPAAQAGLAVGDRILSADGEPIRDWDHWVETVQSSPGQALRVAVERDGEPLTIALTPRAAEKDGVTVGRIGAEVLVERVQVRYGPAEALVAALVKTGDLSYLTVRVIGRMLVGQASLENLSGPITIAKAAGQTATIGFDSFLKFLAIVSISLGVLNLLPIPILDGGHLLYFAIEWIKGSPLSDAAQLQGQKLGIVMLAALMGLAFYLDLSRIFG